MQYLDVKYSLYICLPMYVMCSYKTANYHKFCNTSIRSGKAFEIDVRINELNSCCNIHCFNCQILSIYQKIIYIKIKVRKVRFRMHYLSIGMWLPIHTQCITYSIHLPYSILPNRRVYTFIREYRVLGWDYLPWQLTFRWGEEEISPTIRLFAT